METAPRAQRTDLSKFRRIGLFDSGLGGLSVLRQLAALPGNDSRSFVYVGDTARCPYGGRSPEEIALFVEQIVKWLLRQQVDAIVMACNTSAALAKETAVRASTVPVFDLISPTAERVARSYGRVGVMATVQTAKSQAFTKAVQLINSSAELIEYGCPELVPLVEKDETHTNECKNILRSYIERLKSDHVKMVILGCTHFPFLKTQLEELADGQITFLDPAEILTGTNSNHQERYSASVYVTGDATAFSHSAKLLLGDIPFAAQSIGANELEACLADLAFDIPTDVMSPSVVRSVVK